MLTISPEKAFFILMKAREFDAKVEPDDPESGSNPSDDKGVAILEDFADDPTYQELTDALKSLNEDELTDLLALAWLGRGDVETWDQAVAQARGAQDANAARYLVGTPLLSDYLENGLSELGYSLEDYELGRL
ncbi:MAG: DUF3775 domain-containing protein [Alphaproteobacteria bacterium]|nr:DUF3775 domain-containing protein [Alphaproteobacteria bacterium]